MEKIDQRDGKASMEGGDWRIHVTPEKRARVIKKILETLNHQCHTPSNDVLHGLEKIAKQLEEKAFFVASSQENYVRGIAQKLLALEGHSQRNSTSSFPSTSRMDEIKDSYPDIQGSSISLRGIQFPAKTSSTRPFLSCSTHTFSANASGPNAQWNTPGHDYSQPQFQGSEEIAQKAKQHVYRQSISASFPCVTISMAASPTAVDFEEHSSASSQSNMVNCGMHQNSVVPAVTLSSITGTDNVSKFVSGELTKHEPIKHLIAVVRSISPETMKAAVCDIAAVVQGIERLASSQPGIQSRAAVGQDLGARAISQANSYILQDGTLKQKPAITSIPSHYISFDSRNDISYQFTGSEISNLDSTATSIVKRPRHEVNHVLVEEIRKINRQLVDIVLYIMDDNVGGWEGTLVKCSFNAMSFSSNLKAHYATEMALIQPLSLQVPSSYPNCSPKLLENFPLESGEAYGDLSLKTRLRLSASLRSLLEPLSLWKIACTWESCIHAVILEYVQQFGGGSFSSKYGTWDSCIPAV